MSLELLKGLPHTSVEEADLLGAVSGPGSIPAADGDTPAASYPQSSRQEDLSTNRFRIIGTARRHGLTAFGPISISGANFLTTLVLLRSLPSAQFGQFSFAIVVAGLCLSVTNGLLVAPLASIAQAPPASAPQELNTYLKASVLFAVMLGSAVIAAMLPVGVPLGTAAIFGLYGAAMSLRTVARTHAYTNGRVARAVLSDCTYSLALVLGVSAFEIFGHAHLFEIAFMMSAGAIFALAPFGEPFFTAVLVALKLGSVRAYRRVWQDLTRWSVLGVVTSEVTMNAHAYLVTFICGSKAFAIIAVGALFMRPFSLVLTALPDREGPVMARTIAGGEIKRALRSAKEYRAVVAALWTANQMLAASILIWFPALIARKGYDAPSIVAVVAIWALIAAARGARAPDVMLLFSARKFQVLGNASVLSSVVALLATLALLLAFGPVFSLFGILAGDAAMWFAVRAGVQNWKRSDAIAPLLATPA